VLRGLYFKLFNFRGFYPKGGGEVYLNCKTMLKELKPISILDRGELIEIETFVTISGKMKEKVAIETIEKIEKILSKEFPGVKLKSVIDKDEVSLANSLCVLFDFLSIKP
jgi:RNA 3'-terminal phosphate cyclase